MSVLGGRRESSAKRLSELRGALSNAEALIEGCGCVYATGSFARGDASNHSDLDLFILGTSATLTDEQTKCRERPKSLLGRLREIELKAQLIDATRQLSIPEFSGDGEYLVQYTVHDLTSSLGTRDDDSTNRFTARLLLLLESKPLVGSDSYTVAVRDVVSAYWRDFEGHEREFMPAFLANDILRIWRTFCVNYEAGTQKDPPERNAKRKLRNYKLKHSRMLTCYSGLLALLSTYIRHGTVTPDDAVAMTQRSPTERVEDLIENHGPLAERARQLLTQYERFLQRTDRSEGELLGQFLDPKQASDLSTESYEFGDTMYDLLRSLGTQESGDAHRFYRLLVV